MTKEEAVAIVVDLAKTHAHKKEQREALKVVVQLVEDIRLNTDLLMDGK